MCDIDEFKRVNDRHGHQAGDEVLKKIGALFRETLREDVLSGRFGGDEFCVCFTHAPAVEAQIAIERVREEFAREVFGRERRGQPAFNVSATFGLADLAGNAATREELFEAADRALYAAKERGRNQSYINGA